MNPARAAAYLVRDIDLRSLPQQRPHHLHVTTGCSQVDAGPPLPVSEMQLGGGFAQEKPDDGGMAMLSSQMERGGALEGKWALNSLTTSFKGGDGMLLPPGPELGDPKEWGWGLLAHVAHDTMPSFPPMVPLLPAS